MIFYILFFLIIFTDIIALDYYKIYDDSGEIGRFYFIEQNDSIYKSNSIYIKVKSHQSSDQVRDNVNEIIELNQILDFEIISIDMPFVNYQPQLLSNNNLSKIVHITFSCEKSSWFISKILQESNEFQYVIPERIYRFSSINSNDPHNNYVDYLDSLQINEVWNIVKGDSTIQIGIIDSGVMIDHEDLKQTLKLNHYEIPNDGKDNDNNGFIDDYYGWDFVGDINVSEFRSGTLKPDNDIVPKNKYNNHGTHVAGIACAQSNNAKGISSLGHSLNYIPVKVSADDISQLNYVIKPFEGILYALNRGAGVINCSWLDDTYNPLAQDIVDEVSSRGSIVVCAAGNSNIDNIEIPFIIPPTLRNVISVGAINKDMSVAYFSNYGWSVDIFAPGVSIYSTIMDNQYDTKSGTSMSSPLVASLVGILKKLHPDWNHKQIELQLRANVNEIKDISKSDTTRFWGAIDALAAVKNNHIPNFSNPGITIDNYYIKDTKVIEETDRYYKLFLNVKNLLSKANKLNIKLIKLVDYVEISNEKYWFETFDASYSFLIDFDIKLDKNTPYFEGVIPILVEISAENYRNLELIEVPYKLETSTKFLAAQYFNNYLDNKWIEAKSPSKYSIWAIGSSITTAKGLIFSLGQHFDVVSTSKNPTAIFPFNDKSALIGFKPNNNNDPSELAITNDAGYSLKTVDKPFSLINDIHFFNEKNGIVVGSNNGSFLGIKISNDGGNTWQIPTEIPAGTNETILHQSFKENQVAILTNKGKIYYSDTLGLKWEDIYVDGLVFYPNSILISKKGTILIFNNETNVLSYKYSVSFGENWKTNSIQLPAKLKHTFFLNNTEIIYCLLDNGQIVYSDDYLETWNVILNKDSKNGKIAVSTEFVDSCGIRLWQLNNNLYFSEIENFDPQATKHLTVAGANTLSFDSIKINEKSESKIIFSNNLGNGLVEIIDYSFSSQSSGSFEIEKFFPKFINPCQIYDAKIYFKPKSAGWHYDTLTISSNSFNKEVKYFFSGFAYDPTSITEKLNDSIKIIPNPAFNFITISNLPEDISTIEIFDMMGTDLSSSKIILSSKIESSNIKVDISNLAVGVYYIKIGNTVKKFVKL